MLQKGSQSPKKECLIRKRKPLIAGAGVKHRVNGLSTLSTLHSHTSSCSIKRNRNLGLTMSKPIKSTSKKRQQQYVIKLGNQELVQQVSKSGSMVLKGGEDSELQSLTLQQKVKIIFILLMIPSAMIVFFGNNKFKSDSSNTFIPNLPPQHLAAMGGFGGFGGFPGGFGGGFDGVGGGGGSRPPFHDHQRRHYDHEAIRDHLNRLDPRLRRHVQNSRESEENERKSNKNGPNHDSNSYEKLDEEGVPITQSNTEKGFPNDAFNDEEVYRRLMQPKIDSDFIQNLVSNPEDTQKHTENDINKHEINSDESKKENEINIEKKTTDRSTQKSRQLSGDIQIGFKVILLWTPFFSSWDLVAKGSESFVEAKCPINKCTLTSDKLLINQSDAIVFDARNINKNQMPDMRSPNQRWIFFTKESPHILYTYDFNYLSNLFNWSWTYRTDSDIVYSFGNIELTDQMYSDNKKMEEFNAFDTWRRKSKMIFWFVNSCETHSKRELYVNELKKHIDIDIYGKCGNNSCFDSSREGKNANEDCFKAIAEQYLFAIVFESSFCKDYVTEKVFQALEHNIIPIVMSGANYSRIMPPNSVINAINYSSPKDFADYILDIGADFNKYKTFFEWKRQYQVNYRRNDLCQLCSKLHEKDQQLKHYSNIQNWLYETKCKQWNPALNTMSLIY